MIVMIVQCLDTIQRSEQQLGRFKSILILKVFLQHYTQIISQSNLKPITMYNWLFGF